MKFLAADARMQRKGGKLPPDDVLSLMDQVLATLAAAHAKGIVHRDLKPENIFLTRDGATKVLDFGIARIRELSGQSNATQTGAMMGTPAFMPPEQARSRWDEVDARTDIWAIGATMFTLLTGHHVHEAETVTEALAMAVMSPPRSLGSVDPLLPGPLIELVDKALARDKAERWQDATAMQNALREAYHLLASGAAPAAHRLSIPDDSGIGIGATAAATSGPVVPTGPGVSNTLQGSLDAEGAGLPATGNGPVRKILLMAVAAGAVALVGTVAVLRGSAGGTAGPAPAAAPTEGQTVPATAVTPPVAKDEPPRDVQGSPPVIVVPVQGGDPTPDVARGAKAEKGATARAAAPSSSVEAAAARPAGKVERIMLEEDEPTKALPAPATAAKPKTKPTADPFSGRF